MTPDEEQALRTHLEAIAEMLYDESDPDAMKTFEGIELTIREKILSKIESIF
jgi:hypothetical protein